MPVDALDPDAAWSGYVPYDALPAVVDPASGLIVTANSRVTPDGYPYALAIDWFAPYRTERINHLLGHRTGLAPADLLYTEMDIHSEFDLVLAQRLAYAIDHASSNILTRDPKRLHQAANLLRRWDGNVDADAVAPSIVLAARTALWPMLLVPQIAEHDRSHPSSPDVAPLDIAALYTWGEQTDALEHLVQDQPARWLPREYKSWNDLLTDAVLRGLSQQHAPVDLARWSYGPAHPVELSNPLLSMSPVFARLLGRPTGTGPHSTGGDGTTIKQTARSFGPSERFTADLSSPAASIANITTGQSGNPDSPWYLDQFPLWLSGRSLSLPLATDVPTHTLTLLP
jgi:penicillin amidase